MKTKQEVYDNIEQRALNYCRNRRATKEFLLVLIFSLISSSFLNISSFVKEPFLALLPLIVAFIIYMPLLLLDIHITKISRKIILKEMRRVVDREIINAKESNFSSEEQIKKLEQIKEEIT